MVTILSNRDIVSYGIKEFLLDTEEDFNLIDKKTLYPGSTALVLSNSKKYMCNNSYEWKELKYNFENKLDNEEE